MWLEMWGRTRDGHGAGHRSGQGAGHGPRDRAGDGAKPGAGHKTRYGAGHKTRYGAKHRARHRAGCAAGNGEGLGLGQEMGQQYRREGRMREPSGLGAPGALQGWGQMWGSPQHCGCSSIAPGDTPLHGLCRWAGGEEALYGGASGLHGLGSAGQSATETPLGAGRS
uniref:Uncharacterized protein n=1 Tax=Serinus canaria TaxID=9135 RepID=A0A8C9NWN4_SERCA